MYSGIVEMIGNITRVVIDQQCKHFSIAPAMPMNDLSIGDSIAVNGVCLTITHLTDMGFDVTAVPETLRLTNLDRLAAGNVVNLERSLQVGARNGGHSVQGHVDGTGQILEMTKDDHSTALLVKISLPVHLTQYVVNKGYITLDGMSITVIQCAPEWFTVTLIPHTQAVTITHRYAVQDWINIEVDILGKYIEKLLGHTLMQTQASIKRVEQALQDLRQGKMVMLTDDPERENEGDLIMPAETITPADMNFIIRHTSGIVCLATTQARLQRLDVPLMVPPTENTSQNGTPFTVSVDADKKHGITTGVSALDRTITVKIMIDPQTTPSDLVRPGHIFPLQAKEGGVLERQGHTEGAVDLARLAGMKPAAVLCELMNPDGTMMSQSEKLAEFSKEHGLTMLSIDDMVTYRMCKETLIEEQTTAIVPLDPYGTFNFSVIREKISHKEHMILSRESTRPDLPLLVRIHSSCLTGDLFASLRCDCHQQLHYSLQQISQEGGMLIYLNQEGRGIGLFNKIRAYSLQEQGDDTVEANKRLGLPIDPRNYDIAANLLINMNINHVRLLTNNPRKIQDLKKLSIQVDRVSMPSFEQEHNQFYLHTKKTKLGHAINFDYTEDTGPFDLPKQGSL